MYEESGKLLKSIPGVELVGIERGQGSCMVLRSWWRYEASIPDFALWIGKKWIKALMTSAEILVFTCPFCWRNLDDAAKAMVAKIQVADLL